MMRVVVVTLRTSGEVKKGEVGFFFCCTNAFGTRIAFPSFLVFQFLSVLRVCLCIFPWKKREQNSHDFHVSFLENRVGRV